MAELLKRQNDIVTLKIELVGLRRVRCQLQFLVDGQLQSLPLGEGPASDFGLPEGPADARCELDEAMFRLPPALVQGLRGWLLDRTDGGRPLWVHLVKPYGGLRYLPWERLLGDATGVPVLMLPDFIFPPPQESASLLDIAFCASAPLDCEETWIREGLLEAVAAIREALGDGARLHLFTDRAMRADLAAGLPAGPLLLWHPQEEAAPFVAEDIPSRLHDSSGTLRSPWLLWMRERLRPYATDLVHFIGHGHLSRDRGAMLFAQSPVERTERYLAGPVGSVELSNFLTQVGAWATAFSAPPDNHNPIGLRVLADEIAQSLPGPMLLFNRRHSGNAVGELAQAYRFVFSPEPQLPPRSRAMFLYCQPYLLDAHRDLDQARADSQRLASQLQVVRNERQRDAALATLEVAGRRGAGNGDPGKTVSALTAATERLTEQVGLEYQQVLRDCVVPADTARENMDVAMDTLDRLRDIAQGLERERIRSRIDANLREIERMAADPREDLRVLPAAGPGDPPAPAPQASAPDHGAKLELRLQEIEELSAHLGYVNGDAADVLPRLERVLASVRSLLPGMRPGARRPQ